jgi:hypothetical protein
MFGLEGGAAAGTDWIEIAIVRFAEGYSSVRAEEVSLNRLCIRVRAVRDTTKVFVAQCILTRASVNDCNDIEKDESGNTEIVELTSIV